MTPASMLRVQLAGARAARTPIPFALAWREALRASVEIADAAAREAWRLALEETRASWERAYEGWPATRADAALASLVDGREIDWEDWGRRKCEHCGLSIPSDRDRRAIYCSDRCRRDAAYRRERQAAGGRKDLVSAGASVRSGRRVAPAYDLQEVT